jgi:transcriptional regulator with XRE-family HTH domain
MRAWQSSRQAAAFAAAERTGLTKADIARIAGVHRSQVSRWVSGEQRPSYERTMRLAAHLRREHPELAGELVAAAGYGPVEDGPEPSVPPDVLRVIRKNYAPERQREVIEMLEAIEREQREEGQPPPERSAG